MSDKNRAEELKRLRADLEVLNRYDDRPGKYIVRAIEKVEGEIKQIERDQADPWRDAKDWVKMDYVHRGGEHPVARYVRHLEADNAKLKAENESYKACQVDENGHWENDATETEADPWRRAKSAVEYFRGFAGHKQAEHDVVAYVDHLEAENAAKAKRIDDLESRPVPPLDRKRVIATACKVIRESAPLSKEKLMHAGCLMMEFKAGNAGIYPLEGEDATP